VNFKETEAYLLSLGNEVSAMKLGLENIRRLLTELGDPQKKYLKVQVAGTNGKGSVCAFLSSICVTEGIRTGMFTSPHLVSMTERVKIDGVDIREEDFAEFATQVRELSESLFACGEIDSIPTYFEQVTAIALLAFADAKVELAILETGLGGRLDATTAANAEIAVITRIDLDHQQYLGETIEEIAAEKAAIIHDKFQSVVIGQQSPKALKVILERCQQVGISGLEWEPHLRWTVDSLGFEQVRAATHRAVFPAIELGLRGEHQRENAETAINVIRTLRYDHGFSIADETVIHGLVSARHPGRLEWIGRYLLDGAHNIGGARALRNYLDEFVDRPITMIFGAMSDKDVGQIASILFPQASRLILTMPDNSRAMKPEDLFRFVPDGFDRDRVFIATNAATAIEQTQREFSDIQDVILVTGSLYLVGEVRRILTTDLPKKLKTNN
jgi:dihydrofolate synthase/folylpolyglutamate synthase